LWRKDYFSAGFSFALGAAVLAVLLLLGWQVLQAALEIASPFIAGIVIALLLDPLVDRIQSQWGGGKRLPAVLFVFLGFLTVFVGLLAFVVPNLIAQTQSLVTWFTPMTYTIERASSKNGHYTTTAANVVTTSYTVHGIQPGNYYFRVWGVDSNGQQRLIAGPARAAVTGAPESSRSPASALKTILVPTPMFPGGLFPAFTTPTEAPVAPRPAAAPAEPDAAAPDAETPSPPASTPGPTSSQSDHRRPQTASTPAAASRNTTPTPAPASTPATDEGQSPDVPATAAPSAAPSTDDSTPAATSEAAPAPGVAPTPVIWARPSSVSLRSLLLDGDGAARAADTTPTPAAARFATAPASSPTAAAGATTIVTHRVVTDVTTRKSLSGSGGAAPLPTVAAAAPAAIAAAPAAAEPGTLAATPVDGGVYLHWRAPTRDVSGIDSIRVQIDQWLASHRNVGPFKLPASFEAVTATYSDQATQALKVSASRVGEIVLASASRLLSVILVPIVTFYILADIDRLRGRALFLVPEGLRQSVMRASADIGVVFGGYVRGILLVSLLYGISVMVLFAGFLKSYALLLGAVAGVLYIVPYLGPLVTSLVAAILSLITGHGIGSTLLILGLGLGLNQIFDNVIVPRVVGRSVGLHPLLTMFALLLGGILFGLSGMLLSVPVAASIQAILFRLYPKLSAPTPLSMLMDRSTTTAAVPTAAVADNTAGAD
jgi:predicted PurR-regulated permease PerM